MVTWRGGSKWLGVSWAELGIYRKILGVSGRRFGGLLGCVGRLLGDSWEALEASIDDFGSIFE